MFEEGIGFDQVVTRKLKEARVAKQIEEVYSKDEILQAYINQVNYGHGWRGIETASQNYFGKPAVDLNPAEAAMLAAAVNGPAATRRSSAGRHTEPPQPGPLADG
jgi:penicillin-binding protein 2D